MNQRGATLLETVVAAAIVVTVAAAISWGLGSRWFAERSAATQFDAAYSYAQALAAGSGNGATLAFEKRLARDGTVLPGFRLTVYSGRPSTAGALQPGAVAPVEVNGGVSETELGAVPFAIFLDAAGHAGAYGGTVNDQTVLAAEPGCPPGENSVTLTFSDSRTSEERQIPCNRAVSGSPP